MLAWVMILSLLVPATGVGETKASESQPTIRYRGIERLLARFVREIETTGRRGDPAQNR